MVLMYLPPDIDTMDWSQFASMPMRPAMSTMMTTGIYPRKPPTPARGSASACPPPPSPGSPPGSR
jgi:hypothetical protein